MSPARGELPYVDEHAIMIAAPRVRMGSALHRHILAHPEGSLIARLLGTQPRAGFEVLDSAPAHSLTLAGRHRLARDMLTFELTDAVEAGHAYARPDLRAVSWRPRPGPPRAGHRHPSSHRATTHILHRSGG